MARNQIKFEIEIPFFWSYFFIKKNKSLKFFLSLIENSKIKQSNLNMNMNIKCWQRYKLTVEKKKKRQKENI